MKKPRLLFFSQGVSLAHVARPAALAAAVNLDEYEVHFARTPRMARFVSLPGVVQHDVAQTMSPDRFVERMAVGQPLFDEATLSADLGEDLRVLRAVKPALVVGDLRLSLQVSARLTATRYAALANAHWSPRLPRSHYPFPDHPAARLLGRRVAAALFGAVRGPVFRAHARPLNAVRRLHGLAPLPEMRDCYFDADAVLLLDDAGFYPTLDEATFLGPVVWEPPLPPPPWLDGLQGREDLVLVTLGSTGAPHLMQGSVVSDTARELGLTVMMATAERGALPPGVLGAPYVPGYQAAQYARVMVCNGGAVSTAQALAAGRPFLGLCSNMDQFLSARPLVDAGAGLMLPASEATPRRVKAALARLLGEPQFAAAARALQPRFAPELAPRRFGSWLRGAGLTRGTAPEAAPRHVLK